MFTKAVALLCVLLISGCAQNFESGVNPAAPPRMQGSAFEMPVTSDNVGDLGSEFFAFATITRIGDEEWFTSTDEVTGKQTEAVYYRAVELTTKESNAKAPQTFAVLVHSDIEPTINLLDVHEGDSVAIAVLPPVERNGVPLYGVDYIGLVDSANGVVRSLRAGDQETFDIDAIRTAFGLS